MFLSCWCQHYTLPFSGGYNWGAGSCLDPPPLFTKKVMMFGHKKSDLKPAALSPYMYMGGGGGG